MQVSPLASDEKVNTGGRPCLRLQADLTTTSFLLIVLSVDGHEISHAPFDTQKVPSTSQRVAHPASRTMHSRVQSKTFSPKVSKNGLFQHCVPAVDTVTQIKMTPNSPIDSPATRLSREVQLPGDAHQAIRTTSFTCNTE